MIDLSETYRRLARAWPDEELAVHYAAANRHGGQPLSEAPDTVPERPIALLATAIPSGATLSVAIHVLHALPDGVRGNLAAELLGSVETNAADALHRCHRALELDGLTHSYTADEWLPVIYDIARLLLESSRLDTEPPSLVLWPRTQFAGCRPPSPASMKTRVRPPSALADTLARLLVVGVFADEARASGRSRVE